MTITCECGKRITDISEMKDVRGLGLLCVLYGNCPKCGLRQPVGSELWRRKKVIKGLPFIEKERKSRKSKKLVPEV
jgi:hypothetical protein